MGNNKHKLSAQERKKLFIRLIERIANIILIPREAFYNKSPKKLDSMQKDTDNFIKVLSLYSEFFRKMKYLKTIKNNPDYLKALSDLFGDDIPF